MKQSIDITGGPGKNLSDSIGIGQVSRKNLTRLPFLNRNNKMVNGGVEKISADTQQDIVVNGADRDSAKEPTIELKKQTVPFAALAIAGLAPGPLTIFYQQVNKCLAL